ncbi:fibronectin type III domain-containing protein, partial [Streptomyces prasinopilosus]
MRGVPAAGAVPRRRPPGPRGGALRPPLPLRGALLVPTLLLVVSCGAGGGDGGSGDGGGQPPGAPAGVTAEAGSATSVHVMWNTVAAAGARVSRYEVYRGTTKVEEVPGSKHMVDVTRLRPSTTYAFTVRARDTEGRLGPRSRVVRATTPAAAAADRSAPGRPSNLRGEAVGGRAVQLSWSASTDDQGVLSYDIHQGGTKVHGVGGGQTATVVTGLRPGTRYSFTVRARDAAGNVSPPGAPLRLTTPGRDAAPAAAPTGFRASSHRSEGAYHIDLSWVPPRVDGVITEYQVHL